MYGSPITLSYERFSMTMTTTRAGGGTDADADGCGGDTGATVGVGGASDDGAALEPHPPSRRRATSAGVARRERDMTAPYVDVTDG